MIGIRREIWQIFKKIVIDIDIRDIMKSTSIYYSSKISIL